MEAQFLSNFRAIFDAFFIESPPTATKIPLKVLKVVKVLKVAKPSESLGGLKVAKVVNPAEV